MPRLTKLGMQVCLTLDKRGICAGKNARISWAQVETGLAFHGNILVVFYRDEFY